MAGTVSDSSKSDEEDIAPLPAAGPSMSKSMLSLRKTFAPFFVRLVAASFSMIAISLFAEIAIIFFYKTNYTDAPLALGEKTLMLHVVRTSLGMLLGLVAVALGVVMSWVAVEAPFSFSARGKHTTGESGATLSSVGPGIVLMIGGLVLVGVSLYGPMGLQLDRHGSSSNTNIGPSSNVGPGPEASGVAPLTPQ